MTKNDWDLEAANATYNVEGWGTGYFSINADGNVVAKPLQENGGAIPILDLREIHLVDESVVRFLAECESKGTVLRGCADYIKEWIRRVSESK